jgi:hypothetical protein
MLQFGMINRFIASSHKLQFVAYTLICLVLAGCAPGAGLSAVSDALDGKLPVQIKSAGACFIPESAAGTLNCPVYVANLSRELVNMRNLIVSIGFDQNAPVVRFNDTKSLPTHLSPLFLIQVVDFNQGQLFICTFLHPSSVILLSQTRVPPILVHAVQDALLETTTFYPSISAITLQIHLGSKKQRFILWKKVLSLWDILVVYRTPQLSVPRE